MRIGTLTLHLPFNYGNALQMLSLHRYLREQGYDAEVLGHWFCKDRTEICYWHLQVRSLRGLVRFVFNCLMFNGTFCQFRREAKLMRWLSEKIRWSQEQGETGAFDPNRLTHDVVIVGSDQVWNPKYATSDFFLLPDFDNRIRKVAYAASFGTDKFIDARKPFFRECLNRFESISVRESSAVGIVKDELGQEATLVCDPTLLHTREEWCDLLGFDMPTKTRDDLAMYLVTPEYRLEWREARRLARESGRKVHCFAFVWSQWLSQFSFRHPVRSLSRAACNVAVRVSLYLSGVRLHFSATPSEFVECIAKSDGLITDSFHGMMFATIFGKKCNVTIGEHEERQQMSARLRNFTHDFGRPEILTPRASLSALQVLSVTSALEQLIVRSKAWLHNALEGAHA